MRAIAEIPYKDCKISIFSMNKKFIIKCELGSLEQTYKIAELNVVDGVNGVLQLLDETFMDTVIQRFVSMRDDFNEAYERHEY